MIEMETIGLSRSFPPMLGWFIEPIARRLGRKSVELSLRCARQDRQDWDHCSKTMHLDSSNEFWYGRASLVATTPDGASDAQIPPRLYYLAGTAHVPSVGNSECEQPTNPHPYHDALRAAIVGMRNWITCAIAQDRICRFPKLLLNG